MDAARTRAGVAPGVHGRIPAFSGADRAADRLAALPEWRAARVIKAVPDTAQLPVRAQALEDGKVLYMAVPKLADELPFYVLNANTKGLSQWEAASKENAAAHAQKVGVDQMEPVDMVVCGSVAVNRQGVRIGKGAGYSDIEVALLAEAGLIGPDTTIVMTVHTLQVVDDVLPESEHDFSVDLIVTPDEVIRCGPQRRPSGLYWDRLSPEKIAAIPVLAARAGST
jgi:5-formyltetrahydrofolate cyclo-ligase